VTALYGFWWLTPWLSGMPMSPPGNDGQLGDSRNGPGAHRQAATTAAAAAAATTAANLYIPYIGAMAQRMQPTLVHLRPDQRDWIRTQSQPGRPMAAVIRDAIDRAMAAPSPALNR